MLDRLKGISPREWRDAARRGIQAALAAVLTYSAVRALDLGEAYLAILAAVLILQPSVGGTLGAAWSRFQATVIGSLLGLACLLLLPQGWGTAAALASSMLVVGGIAGLRADWSYGVVAAIAIALAPEGSVLERATGRGLAIAVGAAMGVLVSFLIWPDRAENRFERHLQRALRAAGIRLSDSLSAASEPRPETSPQEHASDFHGAAQAAQEAIDSAKMVDREGMRRRLDALQRLYNSIIILDRAGETSPTPPLADCGVSKDLDAVRRVVGEVLMSLQDAQSVDVGRLERIDHALRQLEADLADHTPDSPQHRGRCAVLFALGEVRRTLAALLEAWGRGAQPSDGKPS